MPKQRTLTNEPCYCTLAIFGMKINLIFTLSDKMETETLEPKSRKIITCKCFSMPHSVGIHEFQLSIFVNSHFHFYSSSSSWCSNFLCRCRCRGLKFSIIVAKPSTNATQIIFHLIEKITKMLNLKTIMYAAFSRNHRIHTQKIVQHQYKSINGLCSVSVQITGDMAARLKCECVYTSIENREYCASNCVLICYCPIISIVLLIVLYDMLSFGGHAYIFGSSRSFRQPFVSHSV